MKITRSILATLLVVVMADSSQAQVGVSGSRVRDEFNYAAGPLDGQSGADERNVIGTWTSAGDVATPGDPFVVNAANLNFGPQIILFDNPALGSIGRNPQIGTGGTERLIGNGSNTNIQSNVTNNFKESFTQLKMVWNGGKVAFALAGQRFDLENTNPKLFVDGTNHAGFGFTIEPDAGDPTNLGILKASAFQSFAASAGNTVDAGAGIQINKGETYQVFVQGEVSNDATFMDHISAFVLSETDVAAPETTVYLADLPATSKSTVVADFNNFNMKNTLQFAMHATQNFQADDLAIGFLKGTSLANLGSDADRDSARQALLAFRTVNQKIAWKSSLGDPYVAGDTRLDGVLLGSATNNDVSSNDINHLQGQIRLGNTSTVSYLDLDSSGVIDDADVEFLVETLYGSNIADFDLDFDVDADDLAAWAAEFGNDGGWTQGDANGNGTIGGGDFLSWQRNFTGTPSVGATSAVPEPTTVALAMLAGIASLAACRRRTM